jgi:Tfp pilus assembly protein PilF
MPRRRSWSILYAGSAVELFKSLGLLYARPLRAIGIILDRGTPWFAAVLAVSVTLAARLPLQSLLLLAGALVPAAAVVGAKLEGAVSAGVALERDYMPALVCHLVAWTAVVLPLAVVRSLIGTWQSVAVIAVAAAGLGYLLVLSTCTIRTISGTSFPRAAAAVAIGLATAVAAFWVFSIVGNFAYIFASPWVLYYLYLRFGSEARALGGGLSSRQRLRQLLETSTVNPRDADARYQLGLIYQHRRDFATAKACFGEAIRIDPNEADPHYQLGRILRREGDLDGAMEHLETAAAIDDKHSSSEVWREIGAACLKLGQDQRAHAILAIYTQRRPFDAEGLYWYGVALSRMGKVKEAREAWQSAVESVRTAPPHRRRQIRRWEQVASGELKKLQ